MAERAASQRPNTELLRQQALAALAGDARLLIQADGQVKVISPQVLGRLHINDAVALGDEPSPARLILPIEPPPRLLAISAGGRVALLRWEFAGQQPGSLERFLPTGLDGDPIISIERLPDGAGSDLSLGLFSSDGRFKRLALSEVLDLSGRATSVVKLKDGISLRTAMICRENTDVILVSDIGRVLRLCVQDDQLPLMGRLAQGPMTMRRLPGENLVGGLSLAMEPSPQTLLLGSAKGRFSRIDIHQLRQCRRGDLGVMAIRLESDDDRLVALSGGDALVGLITSQKRHGRFDPSAFPCSKPGEPWAEQMDLKNGETLSAVVSLIRSESL